MKRRDFLKTGGIAGTAGLILDGCGKPQQLIPLLVAEDRFIPGEEAWVRTLCQQCSAGCGITVRVMQGESIRTIDGQQRRVKAVQAKKIEGNPEHPISMGGTCARGQAGVQVLYHPDRIQTPLKLSGQRGSGQYQPITWKEGQQLLVTQLQQQQATPQAIALLTGRRNRGTMGTIVERFAAGVGTSNVVSYDPFDPAPIRKAMELVTGVSRLPAVDFANANYLLSFNANLFETFLSPVRNIYSYGHMRQGRPGIRGHFVHAEPRLSQTAACADQWLPIKPGTEGLLALSIAHVIVNEKLYDAEFVAQSTGGFAEWSASLGEYAPEKIAAQVDLPAAQIQRVAREFATRRPSVAVGDSRDVGSLTAIYALNALVGAYGKPGGMLFGAEDATGPVPTAAASASRARNAPNAPDAPNASSAPSTDIHALMAAMGGSQIKALLLLDANPLFTLPEAEKLRSALANVPFIASFASFLDESSVMADLILPSHTTLERWVDDVPEPGVGVGMRTVGQPVVEPRWDTRDPGDVLIETAKALGGNAAATMPFDTMEAAVKESFKSVHVLAASDAGDFEAFFKKATAAGGYWQAAAATGPRPTAESPRPFQRVNFVMPAQPVAARAFAGDAGQMPFMLHLYPSAAFADGRSAHLPWLQEMPDPMTTVMWGSWVEINTETAHKLEIHEGDVLTITSPQGSIELPAFLYPGLRPDVIAIPVGQGHTQYGRYAQNRGANPLRISASALDAASGAVVQTGVRVRVAKAGRIEPLIRFGASDARAHHEHPLHR
ncbi:MAG TPA: molybdopterin-dependent oxidoreductase [Vicinamibacterales bacterium]|nr:molybdopterin-dependent oxidoreductase [Vicinamibacterales bacterium]